MSFITDLCNGSKYCHTLLQTVDLRVTNRNFRDLSLFTVDFKSRNCPSPRCAPAAKVIASDIDIFIGRSVSFYVIG
jgi:hypothetical protein